MDAIKRVLVVDDDPVVGRSFDRVLSGKGYAVIHASDGNDALNKLHAENYDLVFTDIKMPGITGLEVAERVKRSQPWLPVVIITGYGTEANEIQAKAAGVAGFLHKPLSPEMIEGSAREALLEKPAVPAPAIAEAAEVPAPATGGSVLKNVALFLAAPFVGLAYLIAFPFIGLGMAAWMGGKALMKYGAVRKTVGVLKTTGLFVAAPFIGLVFAVALPFVGLALLAWTGVRAMKK